MSRFELVADSPEYPCPQKRGKGAAAVICDVCPMRDECETRVRQGLWVLCEIPDERDVAYAGRLIDD